MAKAQPCYMRVGDDDASNDQFNESIAAAKESFIRQTKTLAQIEQPISALLFFVDQQGDEVTTDYPDRRINLSRSGSVTIETM